MDLVSVIIPAYNVEACLNRCILSVVCQTYKNLQIILIDDGSPDNCPQICDSWAEKDPRIRVIHKENGGVSSARNSGLQAASGEYVLQVDGDDYIAPNTIETMMKVIAQYGADMVICDFVKGDDEHHVFSESEPRIPALIDGKEAISRIYTDGHNVLRYVVPWAKLCKKSLYDGVWYPNGKIFEDIYTTHKLLDRCGRIAVLDEPLIYYFQRPNSIMNSEFRMQKLDYLPGLVERLDFFRERGYEELYAVAYDELLHALVWEYSRTRDLLHSEEGKAYVKRLFRSAYQKGYASKRYPKESALFYAAFYCNPEFIMLYWKIKAKIGQS